MYRIVRFLIRGALNIYYSKISVSEAVFLKSKGPLILAANHPNSFMDAIILASRYEEPIHFLAFGELTDRIFVQRALKILRIIPVYSIKEKNENQYLNDISFAVCVDVLLKNGILLIFPEGLSENNWKLRPFKKAAARIVLSAQQHAELQSRLCIQPVGLNYNSYDFPGKKVHIQFGNPISPLAILLGSTDAEKINSLNRVLRERISETILQTEYRSDLVQTLISNGLPGDNNKFKRLQYRLENSNSTNIFASLKKPGYLIAGEYTFGRSLVLTLLLTMPAVIVWITHIFLYYPIKLFVRNKMKQSVYFDSVIFITLFLTYPFYWLALNFLLFFLFKNIFMQILFLGMPFLARSYVCWRENVQRLRNYFILDPIQRNQAREYFN